MSVAQETRFARSGRGADIRAAASLLSAAAGGHPQSPSLPPGLFKRWLKTGVQYGCEEQTDYILSVTYGVEV